MTIFSLRVPDDLAQRFDAVADLSGGRAAVLRRLMAEAAGEVRKPAVRVRGARSAARVMVRLEGRLVGRLDAEAQRLGLTRAAWVAALVRRHLLGEPTISPDAALAFAGARQEVRRIGVNVNQIARALNTAVLEGGVLDTELTALEDFRRELRAHLQGLGEALAGNLAYWAVEW